MKRAARRLSTVPSVRPPRSPRPSGPPSTALPPRSTPPRARVGHFVDDGEASLLDVIDNLLNKGVVLNADLILALADVDLVYIRLSALICAADRLLPRTRP